MPSAKQSHVVFNGKPWCCRPSEKWLQDIKMAAPRNLALICQGTHEQNQKAVEYLQRQGVNANLAEGSCPQPKPVGLELSPSPPVRAVGE